MKIQMKTWTVSLFFALLPVFLLGCADSGQKCGGKLLALMPSESGEYTFQEVKLSTLNDPYSLSGGAAKIYFESLIGGSGYVGKVAQPRYTRSGNTCVPMDAASSMAISLYAQFEKIMMFEARLGTLDMLQWPRKVGLDIHVRSTDGMTHNNAHYFGGGDSIAVLPYNLAGVPLAMNPGVMAHEHFHGHFQAQVNARINAALPPLQDTESVFYSAFNMNVSAKPSVEDVESGNMLKPRGLNAFVLRAWNEGLADLYGAIYSKNPRFFDESLPMLAETRSLKADAVRFMPARRLTAMVNKIQDPKMLVGVSYVQGSYLARLMYSIALSGVETPEVFLVRVMRRLSEVPPAILADFDVKTIEFERILPILLKDFPLNAEACSQIRKTVSKDMMSGSFAKCTDPSRSF